MKIKLDYCRHGLAYCPLCLGIRAPVAPAKRAVPMKDRRKKRARSKAKRDLRREVADAKE